MEDRAAICRSLGIAGMDRLHRIVVTGAQKGIEGLRQKGLNAKSLVRLGYTLPGMKKLGYDESDLQRLGYEVAGGGETPPIAARQAMTDTEVEVVRRELAQLIEADCRANELRQAGYTVHHCRIAGYDAREVGALGFNINELATEYDVHKLRRAGFGVRDLRGIFDGQELRNAGFSATEMRMAGFTIRDLLNFAYTENQVRGAGYGIKELMREGLSKQMVDKSRMQRKGKG